MTSLQRRDKAKAAPEAVVIKQTEEMTIEKAYSMPPVPPGVGTHTTAVMANDVENKTIMRLTNSLSLKVILRPTALIRK